MLPGRITPPPTDPGHPRSQQGEASGAVVIDCFGRPQAGRRALSRPESCLFTRKNAAENPGRFTVLQGLSVLVLSSVGSPMERSLCVGFVQESRGVLLVEASALGVLGDQEEDEQNDRANDRY